MPGASGIGEKDRKLAPAAVEGNETVPKTPKIVTVLSVEAHKMKWNNVKEENETLRDKAQAVVTMRPENGNPTANLPRRKDQDIKSGLELLDIEFLLGVLENTAGNNNNDVTMRKIIFNEILRRKQRHEIASSALKDYAMDAEELYGKDIQCQAMQELAKRTAQQQS